LCGKGTRFETEYELNLGILIRNNACNGALNTAKHLTQSVKLASEIHKKNCSIRGYAALFGGKSSVRLEGRSSRIRYDVRNQHHYGQVCAVTKVAEGLPETWRSMFQSCIAWSGR
jgi:hypothetical protein